jgi:hypothetical protein
MQAPSEGRYSTRSAWLGLGLGWRFRSREVEAEY